MTNVTVTMSGLIPLSRRGRNWINRSRICDAATINPKSEISADHQRDNQTQAVSDASGMRADDALLEGRPSQWSAGISASDYLDVPACAPGMGS